ncbi:hypothetical protein F6P96_22950 (plasmid) [Escherichia coli]|nr:hypothetical protein F6P96_22950 [Escherichia coli]
MLSGALASLAAPAFIIWKLNQKDAPLFGDAKFASDSDLKKSKLLKWEKENDTDILVGQMAKEITLQARTDLFRLWEQRAGAGRNWNRICFVLKHYHQIDPETRALETVLASIRTNTKNKALILLLS